jgi:hypothetical protein
MAINDPQRPWVTGAFVLSAPCDGVNMRRPNAASVAATKSPLPAASRDVPAELICLAMTLALFTLAARIASIW